MRLSVTGSPGPTFGSNGALRSATVNQQTRITAPAQQIDGLIFGCGWQEDGTVTRNPFLLRLLPLGAGDPTFGTHSIRLLIVEGELNAVSLRGDGAIVAAGAYQGDALITALRASGVRGDHSKVKPASGKSGSRAARRASSRWLAQGLRGTRISVARNA